MLEKRKERMQPAGGTIAEGPRYAARRAELRRKAKEAARTRDRQAAAASPDEAVRRERRDRGRSDKGENDESGTTARWHEGCSENRRETAKRDRKRRTPKGWVTLAHHTPLLKIPAWWRRAALPSLPWVVCFLSFFLGTIARGPGGVCHRVSFFRTSLVYLCYCMYPLHCRAREPR